MIKLIRSSTSPSPASPSGKTMITPPEWAIGSRVRLSGKECPEFRTVNAISAVSITLDLRQNVRGRWAAILQNLHSSAIAPRNFSCQLLNPPVFRLPFRDFRNDRNMHIARTILARAFNAFERCFANFFLRLAIPPHRRNFNCAIIREDPAGIVE